MMLNSKIPILPKIVFLFIHSQKLKSDNSVCLILYYQQTKKVRKTDSNLSSNPYQGKRARMFVNQNIEISVHPPHTGHQVIIIQKAHHIADKKLTFFLYCIC